LAEARGIPVRNLGGVSAVGNSVRVSGAGGGSVTLNANGQDAFMRFTGGAPTPGRSVVLSNAGANSFIRLDSRGQERVVNQIRTLRRERTGRAGGQTP